MKLVVLHLRHYFKILAAVVIFVPVHMVNDVVRPDLAAESFLGDATMNIYPSFCFWIPKLLIPIMNAGLQRP